MIELNDLITDKRFMNEFESDQFTLDELIEATKMGTSFLIIDATRLKAVLVGLLQLKRITSLSNQTYCII